MIIKNLYHKTIILAYMLLIIPCMSVYGVKVTMGKYLSQDLLVLSLCIFIIIVAVKSTHIKITLPMLLMVLYTSFIITSTYIFHGIEFGITMTMFLSICIFLILQTEECENVLTGLCIIIWILAILNFVSLFTVKDTITPMYFIGGKNTLPIFLVPGMCFILLKSTIKHDKVTVSCILFCVLSIASIFIGTSATGIVVAIAFVILYFIIVRGNKFNKYVMLGIILACYLLLLFSKEFMHSQFWYTFTSMLGKESSLTDRVSIWTTALDLIEQRPIIGYGRGGEIGYINAYGLYDTKTEVHNFILEILLEGGIVALFIYSLMLFKIIAGLNMNNKKHRIIFFAICMVLINGLTESTVNNIFVMVIMGIGCRYATVEKGDT